jgi:hypothetical protein
MVRRGRTMPSKKKGSGKGGAVGGGGMADGPSASDKQIAMVLEFLRLCGDDPRRAMDMGMLALKTEWVIDPETWLEVRADHPGVYPMFLSRFQHRIWDVREYFRGNRRQLVVDVLKGRRAKATTGILGGFLTRCMANSGLTYVVLGRTETHVTTQIFPVVRQMWDSLPIIPGRLIAAVKNNDSQLTLRSTDEGDALGFSVRDSEIIAAGAYNQDGSPNSALNNLRGGSGLAGAHKTEAAFITNLFKTTAPISKALFRDGEDWNESTPNGRDNDFGESFLRNWKEQGEVNLWNPKFKHKANWSRYALFDPAYLNPANRHPLADGVTPMDLIEDFDEYEKEWFPRIKDEIWLEVEQRYPGADLWTYDKMKAFVDLWGIEYMNHRRARLLKYYSHTGAPHVEALAEARTKDEYETEDPHSPEEAFKQNANATINRVEVIQWAHDKCNVSGNYEHVKAWGNISRVGNRFEVDNLWRGEIFGVRVFHWPWDLEGPFDVAIDPHPGVSNQEWGATDNEFKNDFCWATMFDWKSGLQVAELVTQEFRTESYPRLMDFVRFAAAIKGGGISDNKLPYVNEEAPNGQADFMRENLMMKMYPPDRLYFDDKAESLGSEVTSRLGVYPGGAQGMKKKMMVEAGRDALDAGMLYDIAKTEQEMELLRKRVRRIPQSPFMARQISNYMAKRGPNGKIKYEAQEKGRNTEASIDDSMTCLNLSALSQIRVMKLNGEYYEDDLRAGLERPTEDRPPTLEEMATWDTRKKIVYEMRMMDKNEEIEQNGWRPDKMGVDGQGLYGAIGSRYF